MKRIKIVSVLIALLLAAIISGCIVHEEVSPDGIGGRSGPDFFFGDSADPLTDCESLFGKDWRIDEGLEGRVVSLLVPVRRRRDG